MKTLRLPRLRRPSRKAAISLLVLGALGALLGGGLGLLDADKSSLVERTRATIADQSDARMILEAALLSTPAGFRGDGTISGGGKRYNLITAISGDAAGSEILGADGSLYLWSDGGEILGGERSNEETGWMRFSRSDWGDLGETIYAPWTLGVPGGFDPLALLRQVVGLDCLQGLRLPDREDAVRLAFIPCDRDWLERFGGAPATGARIVVVLERETLILRSLDYLFSDQQGGELRAGSMIFEPYSGPIEGPLVSAADAKEGLRAWLAR